MRRFTYAPARNFTTIALQINYRMEEDPKVPADPRGSLHYFQSACEGQASSVMQHERYVIFRFKDDSGIMFGDENSKPMYLAPRDLRRLARLIDQ